MAVDTSYPALGGDYGRDESPPAAGPAAQVWSLPRLLLGACDPRLTPRLRAQWRRDRVLGAPLAPGRSIVVLGPVPGAGRSTVAALLAVALARYQGPRVLAIDATGDSGLYRRLVNGSGSSMDSVLAGLGIRGGGRPRVAWRWIHQRLSITPDLLLLARDPASRDTAITAAECEAAVRALGRQVPVIVIDTPAAANDPVVPTAVALAHRVVIVAPDDEHGVDRIRRHLPWVVSNHAGPVVGVLVSRSPAAPRRGSRTPADPRMPVIRLPYDPALSSALGVVRWHELGSRTRDSALTLAADLVHGTGLRTVG